MVCVSIGKKNTDEIIGILGSVDFAEIRFDLCDTKLQSLDSIFGTGKKIIATYRKTGDDDGTRLEFLARAVELGASYIDLSPDTDSGLMVPLIARAKAAGCRIILSHHDSSGIAGLADLEKLTGEYLVFNPDIIKFAFKSVSEEDNDHILSFYNYFNTLKTGCRFICFGLGEAARQTRLRSLGCGAPFMYVSPDSTYSTAPGQFTYEEAKVIINKQIRTEK